jgi:transposase
VDAEIKTTSPRIEEVKANQAKERSNNLTDSRGRKVLIELQRGAQAFRYEDERWTPDRIKRRIAERHGLSCNTNYLSEKLREPGYSAQRPVGPTRERESAV